MGERSGGYGGVATSYYNFENFYTVVCEELPCIVVYGSTGIGRVF